MTEIKSIIFDLGGVLLNLDYSRTIREFQKLGIENFEKLYSQKNQSSVFDNFETGKINPQDFISNIDTFSKKKQTRKIL
jgi:putative hydrolase of the HAD superfamily